MHSGAKVPRAAGSVCPMLSYGSYRSEVEH